MSDVAAGTVRTILVDQQDRFGTADGFEWASFIGILRKHHCRLLDSIESDRIKVVKQVFGWFATEDIPTQQIARRLNDLKVSPVFAETWHASIIIGILRNPVYIGLPTWNRRAGGSFAEYVEGRVQAVNEAKRGKRRKPADHIQPDKVEFAPIIDGQTWQKTQKKLDAPNGQSILEGVEIYPISAEMTSAAIAMLAAA